MTEEEKQTVLGEYKQACQKLVSILQQKLEQSQLPEKLLIYGCYGYTGELILDLISHEFPDFMEFCVLGGRDFEQVKRVGKIYSFFPDNKDVQLGDVVIFNTEDNDKNIENARQSVKAQGMVTTVLNCAGPFQNTESFILHRVCIPSGMNYLDLSGEVKNTEEKLRHQLRKETSVATGKEKTLEDKSLPIVAVSGIGFDVIPSDCLVASCFAEFEKNIDEKTQSISDADARGDLRRAIHKNSCLNIAYSLDTTSFSGGSIRSMFSQDVSSFAARKGHRITPIKFEAKEFNFEQDPVKPNEVGRKCYPLSLADISSAYYTCEQKIPNITTYLAGRGNMGRTFDMASRLNWATFGGFASLFDATCSALFRKIPFVSSILNWALKVWAPRGPKKTEIRNIAGWNEIFVKVKSNFEVSKEKKNEPESIVVKKRCFVSEPYMYTARAAILAALKVMNGDIDQDRVKQISGSDIGKSDVEKSVCFATPSQVFGSDFAKQIPHCKFMDSE